MIVRKNDPILSSDGNQIIARWAVDMEFSGEVVELANCRPMTQQESFAVQYGDLAVERAAIYPVLTGPVRVFRVSSRASITRENWHFWFGKNSWFSRDIDTSAGPGAIIAAIDTIKADRPLSTIVYQGGFHAMDHLDSYRLFQLYKLDPNHCPQPRKGETP